MMKLFRYRLTIGQKDLKEMLADALNELGTKDDGEVDALHTEIKLSYQHNQNLHEDLKYSIKREAALLDMLVKATGKNRYQLTHEVNESIHKDKVPT